MNVADTPLSATFPCKPDSHARDVPLAGKARRLTLLACTDAGTLYAVGWAAVDDPAAVGAVLAEMRRAAAANLGVEAGATQSFTFAGATPQAEAGRSALAGRAPDGRPLQAHVAVFAVGTTAFQATMLGPVLDEAAAASFLGGFALAPPSAAGRSR